MKSDLDVINTIKKGDESAIDFLYKKNYRMMTNLIIKNNGTEEEAKDIYQEALIVFWQKVHQPDFELTSKISTFLYSICFNLWRKELERKKRLTSDEGVELKEELDHDKNERINIVRACINSLGDACRQILMLYYFDNMSMEEIAEKMGYANADTAKTKKYKCKQELDKNVKQKYKASDFMD